MKMEKKEIINKILKGSKDFGKIENNNMKIDRKKLESKIEEIIGNGVIECEEVDVTAKKVIDAIEELIIAVEIL